VTAYATTALELINWVIYAFTHLDQVLAEGATALGPWLYVILFVIVFCETGLVVTPFLPGDSLLFATGAVVATTPTLSITVMALALVVAAVLGDAVNYSVGYRVGARILAKKPKWLNPDHIARTERFYAKHGGKTIVLARFVPIVRTFAPFVAGIGKMPYRQFAVFNVAGAIAWVVGFLAAGHIFGNLKVVKRNFQLVVLAIIVVSVIPIVVEWYKARAEKRRAAAKNAAE
jgi:membrane-associated protein